MAVIGTSNISVQNIGTVLNEAGGSVNINQPLTFFTSDAKINKWAKYKPVVHSDLFDLTDDDFKSVAYGLTYTYTGSNFAKIVWDYDVTKVDIKRLSDFRGYDTDAKSGINLAQSSYSYDLIQNDSDLVVSMYTDSSLIRLTDLEPALFSGAQIRLSLTQRSNSISKFYTDYAALSGHSLSWSLPWDVIHSQGVGESSVNVELLTSGGTTLYPLESGVKILTITADVGLRVGIWNSTTMTIGTDASNQVAIRNYTGAVGETLDISEATNLFIGINAVFNDRDETVSQSDLALQIQYYDDNGTLQTYNYSVYKGDTMSDWTLNAGSSTGGYWGIKAYMIPDLGANAKTVSIRMAGRMLKNGSYSFYGFTDWVSVIMKK